MATKAPATDDVATCALSTVRDEQHRSLNGDTGRLLCIGYEMIHTERLSQDSSTMRV